MEKSYEIQDFEKIGFRNFQQTHWVDLNLKFLIFIRIEYSELRWYLFFKAVNNLGIWQQNTISTLRLLRYLHSLHPLLG